MPMIIALMSKMVDYVTFLVKEILNVLIRNQTWSLAWILLFEIMHLCRDFYCTTIINMFSYRAFQNKPGSRVLLCRTQLLFKLKDIYTEYPPNTQVFIPKIYLADFGRSAKFPDFSIFFFFFFLEKKVL